METLANGLAGIVVAGAAGAIGFLIGAIWSLCREIDEVRAERRWRKSEQRRMALDIWRKEEK